MFDLKSLYDHYMFSTGNHERSLVMVTQDFFDYMKPFIHYHKDGVIACFFYQSASYSQETSLLKLLVFSSKKSGEVSVKAYRSVGRRNVTYTSKAELMASLVKYELGIDKDLSYLAPIPAASTIRFSPTALLVDFDPPADSSEFINHAEKQIHKANNLSYVKTLSEQLKTLFYEQNISITDKYYASLDNGFYSDIAYQYKRVLQVPFNMEVLNYLYAFADMSRRVEITNDIYRLIRLYNWAIGSQHTLVNEQGYKKHIFPRLDFLKTYPLFAYAYIIYLDDSFEGIEPLIDDLKPFKRELGAHLDKTYGRTDSVKIINKIKDRIEFFECFSKLMRLPNKVIDAAQTDTDFESLKKLAQNSYSYTKSDIDILTHHIKPPFHHIDLREFSEITDIFKNRVLYPLIGYALGQKDIELFGNFRHEFKEYDELLQNVLKNILFRDDKKTFSYLVKLYRHIHERLDIFSIESAGTVLDDGSDMPEDLKSIYQHSCFNSYKDDSYIRTLHYGKASWVPLTNNCFGDGKFVLVPLLNKKSLVSEGDIMKNCAGHFGYDMRSKKGESRVFIVLNERALKDGVDASKIKRYAMLELSLNLSDKQVRIAQLYGKNNASHYPHKDEIKKLAQNYIDKINQGKIETHWDLLLRYNKFCSSDSLSSIVGFYCDNVEAIERSISVWRRYMPSHMRSLTVQELSEHVYIQRLAESYKENIKRYKELRQNTPRNFFRM